MTRIVILYSELADYTLGCLDELVESGEAEVLLVHWRVNPEAPFKLSLNPKIRTIVKGSTGRSELKKNIADFNPDGIMVSGWLDKDYLWLIRQFKNVPVRILALDNPWKGNLKQTVARLVFPFTLGRLFNFCWVPGPTQRKYALKLGFSEQQVGLGYYSARTGPFLEWGRIGAEAKKNNFPKVFLYSGRYYEFKGLPELWTAFQIFSTDFPDWELWCAGTGSIKPVSHPKIKHLGFVQPRDLFVMPSRYEPWGVALHEMAAAGFPLLVSDKVESRIDFLKEGKNGFVFKSEDVIGLVAKMKIFARSSTDELLEMGEVSRTLSEKNSPSKWTSRLLHLMKNYVWN
jgi:glycosyltransferase involved in cell wall biosynthesis